MDIVKSVLEDAGSDKNLICTTNVEKIVDVEIDEGTLLASDYNEFDVPALRSNTEDFLKNLTRDNVQLLINKVWSLPTVRVDEAIVAKLPKPSYVIPRARIVPKPKPLTKWQQFAKDKGLRTKKKGRSKLKWDEELRKWVPTFGYQRVKAQEQKEWLVELGDDNKPKNDDPRAASSTAKQERTAKNELQRLRNLARAKNVKIPKVGLPSAEHFRNAKQIATAVTVARASTASVGKFQARLPKEKDAKDIASQVPGLKRKRKAPPLNVADEKRRNADLAESVISQRNRKELVRVDIPSAPSASSTERGKSDGGGRKRAGTGGKKGKGGGKKPKGGKGKRDLHTKVRGRKRRN